MKDQDAHCWWALLCSKPNQSQSEANQHSPAVAIHNLAMVHEGHRILEQHRDEPS